MDSIPNQIARFRKSSDVSKLIRWYIQAGYQLLNELLKDNSEPEVDVNALHEAFIHRRDELRNELLRLNEKALAFEVIKRFNRFKTEGENLLNEWRDFADSLERWDFCRPRPRVVCREDDQSVELDGKKLAAGLDDEAFIYVQVLADTYPRPIPFEDIRKASGFVIANNPTRIKSRLPAKLNNIIYRGKKGHVFMLPVN